MSEPKGPNSTPPLDEGAVEYLPLPAFRDSTDKKTRAADVEKALAELKEKATPYSSNRGFARDFSTFTSRAEAYAAEERWSDAHEAIIRAVFLVNRAIATSASSRMRIRIGFYAFAWLAFLLVAGLALRSAETKEWAQHVFGFAYWRYALMGALGGITIVVWGLARHTIDLDFDTNYKLWYLFKPILGALMGIVSVLAILAGLLAVQGNSSPSRPLPLYVVAFLAGFSERFSLRLIDRLMTTLLGGESAVPGATVPAARREGEAAAGGAGEKK